MDSPLFPIAQAGFILLTLVYIPLFIRELKRALPLTGWERAKKNRFIRNMVVSILIWLSFVSVWTLTGKMAEFDWFPFNFAPILLVPLIALIALSFNKSFRLLLFHVSPTNLIWLQSFRFFVEILLWVLFIDNLLPVQMTFEGRNFDILAGISAPAIAILYSRGKISKTIVIIWNIACMALLLNIVTTAILSTPTPIRVFMNEPANYIVTVFPISLLPGVLVPLAYYLHVLSLMQMAADPYRHQNTEINRSGAEMRK